MPLYRRIKLPRLACLLLIAGSLLVPGSFAQAPVQGPTFEVATVKAAPGADPATGIWSPPGNGRFSARHVSLELLLQLAYGIDAGQIANSPAWSKSNLYDVDAKAEDGVALTREELKPRLQALLAQRFQLRAHKETRNTHGYALVVSKAGPHLTQTKGDHFPGFRLNVSPGQMRGENWSMPVFAKYLSSATGFPVVDETALTGSYDISFSYEAKPEENSAVPPLQAALKEATGLVLKAQSVPVQTLVIDSVESKPTEN